MYCTWCSRSFQSPRILSRHVRSCHPNVQHYVCFDKNCKQSFHKLYNYERHLMRFHINQEPSYKSLHILPQNETNSINSTTSFSPECTAADQDQSNLPNFNEYQETVVQYCSEICSSKGTNFNNIVSTINSSSNLIMDVVDYLKNETLIFISKSKESNEEDTKSLMNKFDKCRNSLVNFNSKYKILKELKSNGRYVEPIDVVLGTRYEQKLNKDGIPCQVLKKDTCMYISIIETIKTIISVKGFVNLLKTFKNSSSRDSSLRSIHDGFYYFSNPVLTSLQTIVIELYIDEAEVVNPLGSHAGQHKLGFVYFSIKDLPLYLQSALDSIFLVNVHYALDVQTYGYQKMFEPLIHDLNMLRETGVEINGETFRVVLWQIVGDNLGLNKLFGFVESFSANYCCRFCLVHKNTLRTMTKEDIGILRSKQNYDDQLAQVLDETLSSRECGIKQSCPFNTLGYWHVTDNLAIDVMHDLFEGWCATETFLILSHFILHSKFFTLSILNDRILNFNYGKSESRCKPVPIAIEKLTRRAGSVGQSASQMWTLIRNLPLLIGDKIPYDNEFWHLFLTMLTIIDTLMAPVISLSETYQLAENISDHHKLFLELYPERYLTPKMHFAVHYPRIIRQLGPPIRYWSMRYESKHFPAKKCASSTGNFINIAKTIAHSHQLKMARILNAKYFASSVIKDVLGGNFVPLNSLEHSEIIKNIQGVNEGSELLICNSLTYNGTTYSKNMTVFVSHKNEKLLFGKIKVLFIFQEQAYAIYKTFEATEFDYHYYSYVVNSVKTVNFVDIGKLYNYVPLNIRTSYSLTDKNLYITLRHKPCCTNEA